MMLFSFIQIKVMRYSYKGLALIYLPNIVLYVEFCSSFSH